MKQDLVLLGNFHLKLYTEVCIVETDSCTACRAWFQWQSFLKTVWQRIITQTQAYVVHTTADSVGHYRLINCFAIKRLKLQ